MKAVLRSTSRGNAWELRIGNDVLVKVSGLQYDSDGLWLRRVRVYSLKPVLLSEVRA